MVLVAAALFLLVPQDQRLKYTSYTAGQENGQEEVTIASGSSGSLVVTSRFREKADPPRLYETELVVDAKTLAPRSYWVRASQGDSLMKLDFAFDAGKVRVTAGELKREAPREAQTLLVDPYPVAHFVMLATKSERAGKRVYKAMLSGSLEAASLSVEERGETHLIGKGQVVPVRKIFMKMEPLGLMAYIDKEGRLLVLVNPFNNRRFVLEGFESHQIARRGSISLPEGVEETDVQFRSGEVQLSGSITAPKKSAKMPVVVVLHGPGAVDRDGNTLDLTLDIYRTLAYELSGAGYAVLRYDKRGSGRSEGNLALATLNDLVEDAKEAVRFARSYAGADPDRVILIGHDEGGVIAPILAANDARVKALVLLAAPAEPLDTVLLEQFVEAARTQKMSQADVDRMTKERREYFDKIRGATDDWLDLGGQGKAFIGWLREHFNHRPQATLKKVRCPIFVLHGDRDRQVLPAHAPKLEAAVKGSAPCEMARFKGLDHMFMESEEGEISRYADDRVVDAGFLRYVIDALKRTVKP